MKEPSIGAVVVGGEHPGLGVVRSLGRRGIPVYVVDDQFSISKFSRYVTRVVQVKDLRDENSTVDCLLDIGSRHNLKDWVLFPTRDETVAAVSRRRDSLSEVFRVTTPPWECVEKIWDKKNTYDHAAEIGIPVPRTFSLQNEQQLEDLVRYLPLAVKPAVKENFFYATGDKAWRAETPEQLRALFRKAAQQIRQEEILVQEIVPGDGQRQYSYCAFFKDGEAHSSLIAKRLRQHPREFGRAATYVETIGASEEAREVENLSIRFLKSVDFYGLVELEFKQDPRNGQFKLLDVNARIWGFHILGQAAGVDFPYLLFADQVGEPIQRCAARPEVGWLRALTDLPTAALDLWDRELSLGSYFRSLRRTGIESVFSLADPLPFFAEMAMLPYLIKTKSAGSRKGNAQAADEREVVGVK